MSAQTPDHRADVPASAPTASGVDDAALTSLRRWNLALTVLHGLQAVAVLVLATDFAITVTSSFPRARPAPPPPRPRRSSTCASAGRSPRSCCSRPWTTA